MKNILNWIDSLQENKIRKKSWNALIKIQARTSIGILIEAFDTGVNQSKTGDLEQQ